MIEFKPNCFNKLFRTPAGEICDNTFPANQVIGKGAENLYEQLLHAPSVSDMVSLADQFLMDIISRQKAVYTNDGITKISCQLINNINPVNVSQYAYQANMSVRNFERRFTEQVGTSPNFFVGLLRFNTAFKSKISYPDFY